MAVRIKSITFVPENTDSSNLYIKVTGRAYTPLHIMNYTAATITKNNKMVSPVSNNVLWSFKIIG